MACRFCIPCCHRDQKLTSLVCNMRMRRYKMAEGGEKDGLSDVDHVILVLSGKGGVGKSTVTTQLALGLVKSGKKVGILDVDLCGPSIPQMLGLKGSDVHQSSSGWVPVFADRDQRLSVMSIGFLLAHQDDAVIWRGPKKNAMIKQFVSDVMWGNLDYLLVDTPPGTSDEHISTVEALRNINPDGAVIVTTPQAVSLSDVRREVTFCRKTKLPILGLVENMSGFVCPHCSECSNLFSTGGGESLARETKIPFLGRVPLDPRLAKCLESGVNFTEEYADTDANTALTTVVQALVTRIQS